MTTVDQAPVALRANRLSTVAGMLRNESPSAVKHRMLDRARAVLRKEAMAIEVLSGHLNDQICVLADHILSSPGMVVVSGVGKSLLVGEKISATLSSTGTRSITLDPTSAMHGDLGRVHAGDVVLVLSNSGETSELVCLVRALRAHQVLIAVMTGNAKSPLALAADIVLDVGPMQEACSLGLAPTTTTTAMMALGDALAVIIQERRGFTRQDFGRLHPGGNLGRKLQIVRDVMWPIEIIPVLRPDTLLSQALLAMCRSSRASGVAVVFGERSEVTGILSGENIVRSLARGEEPSMTDPIERFITPVRHSIHESACIHDAIQIFRQHDVEMLLVEDAKSRFAGLLPRRNAIGVSIADR